MDIIIRHYEPVDDILRADDCATLIASVVEYADKRFGRKEVNSAISSLVKDRNLGRLEDKHHLLDDLFR